MLRAQLLDRRAHRDPAARASARTPPLAPPVPPAASGAEVTGADGRTPLARLARLADALNDVEPPA
ncbi:MULTISPECIES: hypothetical protein [Streptomyces]|uniref:hypothetical protein n=1 Tax=Streptomyces TaxID=1883 RepID=UPI0022493BF1|nr:hypothetical protein [Streptomyces sp. JHD 1]MCX2969029.1 hypothetical protein [Streptomyces sp. JHD 1]